MTNFKIAKKMNLVTRIFRCYGYCFGYIKSILLHIMTLWEIDMVLCGEEGFMISCNINRKTLMVKNHDGLYR